MKAVYTDIDLKMNMHPVTGDLAKKTNRHSIIQSIKLLIMSNQEEIIGEPYIGGNLTNSLFKLNDPLFRLSVESRIKEIISNYEPRCQLSKVTVFTPKTEPQLIKCRIEYSIMNIEELFIDDIELFRTR